MDLVVLNPRDPAPVMLQVRMLFMSACSAMCHWGWSILGSREQGGDAGGGHLPVGFGPLESAWVLSASSPKGAAGA